MRTSVENTPAESVKRLFELQKERFGAEQGEPVKIRKKRLLGVRNWIHANRGAIHEAMYADFRKPATEVDGTEIFPVLSEIKHALSNLDRWASPRKVDAPMTMLGTRSYIQSEPMGVCLIIAPWNYPFMLGVGPLVSALAAGNRVIMKPSEFAPNVSAIVKKMVTDVFEDSVVAVCEGAVEVSEALLKLPFDHIFFTGSPGIGKIVMKAAAENLTSVTLELGGKSPAIVTKSANLNDAALRIAVAKFINNGQTCLAPDYVLVDATIADDFIHRISGQIVSLFDDQKKGIEKSASYARIINEKNLNRLTQLMQEAIRDGAKLAFGGQVEKADLFIHPTILTHVPLQSRIMEEEIFGPILPVVSYQNLEDAIKIVKRKPKPLALYVFTKNSGDRDRVLHETSSGAACVNDCAVHFLHPLLPFGGVNNSGVGKSHGYYGFLAFSNEKPVLKQRSGLTSIKPFFPPYTATSKKMMDWFLKLF